MKRQHMHSASCSCTSCVYRSRSKQPSVQQIIQDGSRIDRLYYGKYLPLRERKLLEKLIRTRAVYDDVRNQLISTSGSSDQTRSEHKMKRRDDDSTEKSSVVLKMVDLVDRGHIGSSNASKLSSCCSCCSCSSLKKIKKHMEKHPPKVHRHHVPYEEIARYTVEAEKRGRRRRRRLSTKISSKIRAVHFKMKKSRSEPCTCTVSLSSMVTRASKAFMKKKVRSKEKAIETGHAQKVKIDRKALKKKICSCSCKIAKLPMKSLKKIKNIRTSTIKDSETEVKNQRDFKIKKDSLTLFREKLLKKTIYKDWECEPGTCEVDECIPEQCLKKIKARGVGETKRRKYHSRHSWTERDRSRISLSTRPKKVKVTESRVQAKPRPTLGPVICECKPTTKSVSSMTSFPKQKPQVALKETLIQEKTYKADRYPHKRAEFYDTIEQEKKKQALPEPTSKSTLSITNILKKKRMKSTSKSEMKVKTPVSPKPRQQFEIKETTKQEKAYKKTGRHEKVSVQVSSKSNLGHVICECKPSTKSTSSMTSIPKAKASKSLSKTMKPKPKPQLVIKEVVIEEKTIKPQAKPQIVVKEMVLEEKAYKTNRHEKDLVQVSAKSNLGNVICECKPSTKSTASMTSIPKAKASKSRSKIMKPKPKPQLVKKEVVIEEKIKPQEKPQIVVKEMVLDEKAYKTNRHEKDLVQVSPKSNLGNVICECTPSTKSTASMTSIPKSKASKSRSKTMKPKLKPQLVKKEVVIEEKIIKPQEKPQIVVKEIVFDEKAYKTNRHEKDLVQVSPKSNLGNVICECTPSTKSTASMTSIPKAKASKSRSKTMKPKPKPQLVKKEVVIEEKIMKPQEKPQIVVKEMVLDEKAYKTNRHEKDLVQVSPKSNLGNVICECTPSTKSTASMTSIPKSKASKSRSKTMKPKPKPQLVKKEVVIEEKIMKPLAKPRPLPATKPTKSTASMISIPKSKASKFRSITIKHKPKTQSVIRETVIQEKASKKARPKPIKTFKSHEIEKVQSPPKSNLGHVICECKPSTKSTYSMTSVPETKSKITDKTRFPKTIKQEKKYESGRHKPIKQEKKYEAGRHKPIKQEKKYEAGRHRLRREPYKYYKKNKEKKFQESEIKESEIKAVKISSSFKFEIEFSKKRHPGLTNKENVEHVKAKRAKRMKPTHGTKHRKYQHSKTQFTGILPKASHETYLREYASQTSKPYRGIVLPFPRECEPLMCIPYECDPKNCARILMSRSKSRGRSVMSSTDRLRRKSVGSSTFSQKTSSKSKYTQPKSTGSFIEKYEDTSKRSPLQILEKNIRVESSRPQKQAVRISSNFSFDIEFYKDKSPNVKADGKKYFLSEPQKKIIQKDHRRKYKDRSKGTRNISSRHNISSQARSSQSFKNIQVGHKLKRCFCTLRLLQKKKQKVRHTVSKETMASLHVKEFEKAARIRQTQTKSSGIAYVTPPVTSNRASLLPYECEPFFCTPGECNPYECAERIKQRNRRDANRFAKETNTAVTRRKSTFANTSHPLSESLSKKMQSSVKRNKQQKARHSHSSKIASAVSSDKSQKQAVRIGSSINFNIEFSKKINNQQSVHERETSHEFTSDKPTRQERQYKGIKVYKPRIRHETSETTKYVKTKKTHTEPFLQKCLCTLKLLKKNKKKVETLSPWRNKTEYVMHMQNKSITTNRADIHYNLERSKLYECEPGVCVPERDPYKSEKLIKLRQMKLQHKYSKTGDLSTRSTFSETSRTVTSSKSQNTQLFTRDSQEKTKKLKSTDKDSNEISTMSNRSKQQTARVGSSLSFNIEFFKEKSSLNKSKDNVITTEDVTRKHNHKKEKLKTTEYQKFMRPAYHKSIEARAKRREKGNYIGSAIKRCFCTLKFHMKEKNARLQNKNNVVSKHTKTLYPLPNPQICECKSTSTKINMPRYDLSHECAPNFCIAGMCDPYECYEEIKRQEVKQLHDRYVSTDRQKRKTVMSVTTSEFSGSSKAKSTQYRFLKHTKKRDQKVRVIPKEMNPTRSLSPPRQAVRIGSNFSFNIEFSKNHFVPSIQDITNKSRIDKYNAARVTSTITRIKDKGATDRRVGLKHRLSQETKIRKENKASNVGFILKRCFCTLGLQEKNNPKRDFHRNQPIPTQFIQVQVDQNKRKFNGHNLTKSRCNVLNKTLCGGEPVELKLPEGGYLFKENLFGHQNGMKNVYTCPQHLPKSSSFTKRAHFKSRTDFNFDDYQIGYLLNTQKLNPFFQSFYALNVQVSKLKNVRRNYPALEDNECEPGVCVPYECDPIECLERIKNRLKRSKLSETDRLETRSVGCYKKCKFQFQRKNAGAHSQNKKSRNGNNQESPTTVGSDLRIRMGIYKDTDPYKKTETHLKKYKQASSLYNNNNFSTYGTKQQSFEPSRQAFRVGSDLRLDMAFFKEPNISSDGDMMTTSQTRKYDKNLTRRNLRHTYSQVNYETQDKATGISHLLTRCFCTAKLNKIQNVAKTDKSKKDSKPKTNKNATKSEKNIEATKLENNKKSAKPEKNTKVAKPEKNKETAKSEINKSTTKPEKSKTTTKSEKSKTTTKPEKNINNSKKVKDNGIMTNKRFSHGVGTEYPKYKSTSSLLRRRQSFKSKTGQSRAKDWSSCSNYCIPKKRQQHKNSYRSSNKHNVTFGSHIHFNMEFFKDRSENIVYPKIQRIGDGDERGQNGSTGTIIDKCKCKNQAKKKPKGNKTKNNQENVDSMLDPNQCEPHTCIHKRRLRSKNTKVHREKYARSVKSAVTDTSIKKRKSGSKSLKECYAQDCEKKLKALGVIEPDVSKTKKKKGKKKSLSTEKAESNLKSSNTDKQKTSVLRKCFCVFTLRISKQATTNKQYDKGTSMNKKIDLNTFIEKCYCALKNLKGGKQLTPKQSTQRIGKVNETPKPYFKLEKRVYKTKQSEMMTIMPYSEKKFKKLESKTLFKQGATNTTGPPIKQTGPGICTCAKTKDPRVCICAKTTGPQMCTCTKKTGTGMCTCKKKTGPGMCTCAKSKDPQVCICAKTTDPQMCTCAKKTGPGMCTYAKTKDPRVCICAKTTDPQMCTCAKKTGPGMCTCAKTKDPRVCICAKTTDPQMCTCAKKTCPAICTCATTKDPRVCICTKTTGPQMCTCTKKTGPGTCTCAKTKDPQVCTCAKITDPRMCTCAKTKGKKNIKTKDERNQKGPQVVTLCPVCKNISNAKSGKQCLNACVCPNMDVACLCNELEGLCAICKGKANGKYNQKSNKKKMLQAGMCMGDGKQVGKSFKTDQKTLEKSKNILFPSCNKDNNNSQKKLEKASKDDKSECNKAVCPCCKKTFSIETIKSIKQRMMCKISSVCSSLFNKRKLPCPSRDMPLFEMLIDKNNMNILNRDDVLKNISSSGEQSREIKKPWKASQKGNVDPPLMEMIIDKRSANIVNANEIRKRINYPKQQIIQIKAGRSTLKKGKSLPARKTAKEGKSQKVKKSISQTRSERKALKAHISKCKCCACKKIKIRIEKQKPKEKQKLKPKGKQKLTPKEKQKHKQKPGAKLAVKPRKLKPCICGSIVCKKNWTKLKREQSSVQSLKIKSCVCGSDICKKESKKMPEVLLKAARKVQRAKEKKKQDILNEKLYQAAREQRKKQYRIEDKQRWKVRRKHDRREMKLVKKYDTAPDVLMVAESLIDFGTFGHFAFCDIMRSIFRVLRHPRDGIENVKDAIRNPHRAVKDVKESCKGMGFYSTMARIKRRMTKMPIARSAVQKLESYPVTNYLIHLPDKDPKQRMKKFKKRRVREPMEFHCSLFMGSLRKRPWLGVYYMCPWFYPHCINMLGLWRQFIDIILFILAVGVWSPCILCMELCRAMVCCCLCTG